MLDRSDWSVRAGMHTVRMHTARMRGRMHAYAERALKLRDQQSRGRTAVAGMMQHRGPRGGIMMHAHVYSAVYS